MPRPYGFGREARLSSRKDFQRVFSDGRKVVGRNLILWHYTSPSEGQAQSAARLGLSVSAKVGKAVRRTRLKRLVREAFRRNRPRLTPSDLVVYLRPGCGWEKASDAEADLLELCAKAGLLP